MAGTGLEDVAQVLPLALTAAILLTLVGLLFRSRRLAKERRRENVRMDARGPITPGAAGTAAPGAAAGASRTPAKQPIPPPACDPLPAEAAVSEPQPAGEPVSRPDASAVEPGTPPVPAAAEIRSRIARAQAAGTTLAFAELHLELAERLVGDGELFAAAAELRKSILSAARLRQHGTHASARLLLGDLAEREGDLTTACEHWQIARSLFQDLAARDRLKGAETRMRRIGCPTDWVLNDF